MKLGLKPSVMPKTKPGDFERALQLAATFGSKDAVAHPNLAASDREAQERTRRRRDGISWPVQEIHPGSP